jgi:uncharacterized membrane protein
VINATIIHEMSGLRRGYLRGRSLAQLVSMMGHTTLAQLRVRPDKPSWHANMPLAAAQVAWDSHATADTMPCLMFSLGVNLE